jgi:hypothetical protein
MATKFCEVCSKNVVNLNRHLKSKKHLRFQNWTEYGNYSDDEIKQQNNILAKQLKDKTLLSYLYAFFAYILYIMSFQRVKR